MNWHINNRVCTIITTKLTKAVPDPSPSTPSDPLFAICSMNLKSFWLLWHNASLDWVLSVLRFNSNRVYYIFISLSIEDGNLVYNCHVKVNIIVMFIVSSRYTQLYLHLVGHSLRHICLLLLAKPIIVIIVSIFAWPMHAKLWQTTHLALGKHWARAKGQQCRLQGPALLLMNGFKRNKQRLTTGKSKCRNEKIVKKIRKYDICSLRAEHV